MLTSMQLSLLPKPASPGEGEFSLGSPLTSFKPSLSCLPWLRKAGCAGWNVEPVLGGDREVRGAELAMLSKTFSNPSNNRAFMEMANLGF